MEVNKDNVREVAKGLSKYLKSVESDSHKRAAELYMNLADGMIDKFKKGKFENDKERESMHTMTHAFAITAVVSKFLPNIETLVVLLDIENGMDNK